MKRAALLVLVCFFLSKAGSSQSINGTTPNNNVDGYPIQKRPDSNLLYNQLKHSVETTIVIIDNKIYSL